MTEFDVIADATSDDSTGDGEDAEFAVDASQAEFGANTDTYNERDAPRERNETDSSDDVDPKRLHAPATVDDIRWHYRMNAFGGPIVDKPVDDAFKHGFEVKNDPSNKVQDWLEDTYVPAMKSALRKSRRDGFAFIFWILDEAGDTSAAQSPITANVKGLSKLKVLDLDDLDHNPVVPTEAIENTDYRNEQLRATEHGIVVVDDINHVDHEELVGVVYDQQGSRSSRRQFIHADRLQHFVSRPDVDGDVDTWGVGHLEGDSVLAPIIHPLRAIKKTEWALGQAIFRYSAPLHAVEIDGGTRINDIEDHIAKLNKQLNDVNNASSVTLPPGHEMKAITGEAIDPAPYVDALIDNVCAGSGFTRSVLLGTQTGTVSGSETDIKNFFNYVERIRRNEFEAKMHEAVSQMSVWDRSTIPTFSLGFDLEWGPLFKLDQLDAMEALSRLVQSANAAINSYTLTPAEVRSLFDEHWAEFGLDVDLSEELTEEDYDIIDRTTVSQNEQTLGSEESEVEGGSTRASTQNGGGRRNAGSSQSDAGQ